VTRDRALAEAVGLEIGRTRLLLLPASSKQAARGRTKVGDRGVRSCAARDGLPRGDAEFLRDVVVQGGRCKASDDTGNQGKELLEPGFRLVARCSLLVDPRTLKSEGSCMASLLPVQVARHAREGRDSATIDADRQVRWRPGRVGRRAARLRLHKSATASAMLQSIKTNPRPWVHCRFDQTKLPSMCRVAQGSPHLQRGLIPDFGRETRYPGR
jgi:hypothetical protein